MKVQLNDITNKDEWVSTSQIMKYCFHRAMFVKTQKINVEFFKHNKQSKVNITNWDRGIEKHIFYKLAVIKVDGKTLYVVEAYSTTANTLVQSNTFNTVNEAKDYLKDK